MAALDNDSDSELELEEKQFTIGPHAFQVHVVGELPLETLFALESKRDEISGQRAWPGSLLLAAEVAARPALCLLYTSPSPRDKRQSRMPSSA